MKKLLTAAILLITITVNAQTEDIDKICTDYDAKIATAKEEGVAEEAPSIKVTATLTKRAIGPVNHEITIYFDEHETVIEDESGETDIHHKEAVIRKVEFRISSVSYTIDYSYYFDKGGLLVKYAERNVGYSCYLRQTYFGAKGAIRIKQDKISRDNCQSEEEVEVFDHKDLTKKEKADASWLIEDANKFRQILFLNYELIKD